MRARKESARIFEEARLTPPAAMSEMKEGKLSHVCQKPQAF
jgi:hypothetical protein